MNYKVPYKTYVLLLTISLVITCSTFFFENGSTINAIFASLGAGGIASVCVAWLLDMRNTKNQTIENNRRVDQIFNQFIRVYKRLLWDTANECYIKAENDEGYAFKEWLSILISRKDNYPVEGQESMKNRCLRISTNVELIQRQIEVFRSQSPSLIFLDFPDLEQTLEYFDRLWMYCWGNIKALEQEEYKVFVDTIYIIFSDFVKHFPQYKECFPEKYTVSSLKL